ncbi:MAG: putative lipid II flippase FtsW [Verrucomicrobia bacterium]|nr:MAG: putative lipid II flippase FtsW [Verrucomicrobiota bacterium]
MKKTTSLLIALVLILTTFGIIMLASASPAQAEKMKHGPYFFVEHQLIFLALALVVGMGCALVDYRVWIKLALPVMLLAVVLLVAVRVPPLRHKINGSYRWLMLGPVNFQPSELAKFAVICWLAWWMSHVRRRATDFKMGLVMPMAGLGLILVLLMVEPDFGTTFLIAFVGMLLMYLGGSRFKYLAVAGMGGLLGFAAMIMHNSVRSRRILAFLWPDEYAKNEAFQLNEALHAFVLGGPTGVGFGASMQKQHYLPEAHTDFIFPIIGEELGLIATLLVVLAFIVFFILGMRISFRAPDQFGRLLAFGITMMITLQAAINIAVVTGCMPTKGLALPFISYGGSSILLTYAMVGVLINIARQVEADPRPSDFRCIRDQHHDF